MNTQSINCKIDWLTITKPSLDHYDAETLARTLYEFDGIEEWKETAPLPHYHIGIQNRIGATAGSARKPQGTLLQWSGSALLLTNAMTIIELSRLNDYNVTRCDVTMDFEGYKNTVSDYLEEFLAGQCNTQVHKHSEIKSEDNGHTIYLGSRKSARFARIYNKYAEEAKKVRNDAIPEDWLRCEVCLRDEHARSAVKYILAVGMETAIPGLLRGFMDFPNIAEYSQSTPDMITTKGAGRKDTDTRKWLIGQVLPVMIREFAIDIELMDEYLQALMLGVEINRAKFDKVVK